MAHVLVTGASQGIGAAVARAWAARPGTTLFLVARNAANLEREAAACRDLGARAHVLPCDVTDDAAVARLARDVQAIALPDALVCNAGSFTPGALADTPPALFRAQIEANLTSAFLVTHAFLPALVARGSGHLFYMGSVASIRAYPGGAAYCAAKHGLLGLARVVREETRAAGLRVTTLLPGATRTPSWDGTAEPDSRFMPPEDVAAALLMAWDASARSVVEEILLRPQLGDL